MSRSSLELASYLFLSHRSSSGGGDEVGGRHHPEGGGPEPAVDLEGLEPEATKGNSFLLFCCKVRQKRPIFRFCTLNLVFMAAVGSRFFKKSFPPGGQNLPSLRRFLLTPLMRGKICLPLCTSDPCPWAAVTHHH